MSTPKQSEVGSGIASVFVCVVLGAVWQLGCGRTELGELEERAADISQDTNARVLDELAVRPGAQDPTSESQPRSVDELWKIVRDVSGPELPDSASEEELFTYWYEVGYECRMHVRRFITSEIASPDEAAREWLLKGIGADGADGMRWLATAEGLFFPRPSMALTPAAGIWYEWDMAAAKAELDVLLSDVEARRDLYRIFAWRWPSELEVPYFLPLANQALEGLRGEGEVDVRMARSFVYALIATGREDLLEDADPNRLRDASQEWATWMEANIGRMRASSAGPVWIFDPQDDAPAVDTLSIDDVPALFVFPVLPFPTWSGPPPLPPKPSATRRMHPIFY